MNSSRIQLTVNPGNYRWDAEFFRILTGKLCKTLGLTDSLVIDLTLVDVLRMSELNQTYRGKPGPTDVISFALEEGESGLPADIGVRHLGEIFLCPEVIERQAQELAHAVEYEMSFIYVHGLLHLLGHDHPDDALLDRMNRLTERILEADAS